ncbi:DAO-domain-containing protein [Tilletiaria anomala UBC 951]|uniref:Glycerol-3-phosphate dehydrogenase n=1 Tax=Tilletiaria anomala (strain ATCC 24038 / CBS 436.72 / UBC 951) TaxID=1037660 RepID=A0A066W696_TILAU|nr:DAO-domain-containing protein [Tilletiaria anomala UBC 951]KDN46609.1 DAO-domain-containing protein [Tilletiaria anomala UBC 951]
MPSLRILSAAARHITQAGSSRFSSRTRSYVSSASPSFSSGFRSRNVLIGTCAVVALAAVYGTAKSVVRSDAVPQVPEDQRPHPLWVPPTREQMLAALRASSTASLRPTSKKVAQEQAFLLLPAAEAASSSPSPSAGVPPASEHKDALRGQLDGDPNDQGFDLLIVGGGATGTGVAVDAATRGLSVALVERDDFGAGTSSKSTKLVHGGVRYLQKAIFELDYEQYKMVREALHERKTFLHIAPYLSDHLPIMLPVYRWWQIPYYWAGTKMYDILAGSENMESSYVLGKGKALDAFPMLKKDGLAGAVVYYDGQHNDTRMNIALALTAVHHGAVLANHTEVIKVYKQPSEKHGGEERISGVRVKDVLTNEEWNVKCKGLINATGPFSDTLRKLDQPTAQEIVAPSSGVHITLPGYYSPRSMGLIDPQTSDGRVIFFLPWQGNTIAGTTDTAAPVEAHPKPKEEEIQWILDEVRNYLSPDIKVRRGDVLSAWSGLRPLVKDPDAKDTQSLVRNHMINVSASGLLTIAGGKWTTYREMAEQTVDEAIRVFDLKPKRGCVTKHTRLLGSHGWSKTMYVKLLQRYGLETEVAQHLSSTYGDRAWSVCSIAEPTGKRWPVHGIRVDPLYPYIEAEVRYAVRSEYAATAVDFLARRSRLSFLNVESAAMALPRVVEIMTEELGWDKKRQQKELKETLSFLESMGMTRARIDQLSQLDLKQLRTLRQGDYNAKVGSLVAASNLDERDLQAISIGSRAQFSSEEMDQLHKQFNTLDTNSDGKLDSRDLKVVLDRLGYEDIKDGHIAAALNEVDFNKTGFLRFEDFLDVVGSLKDGQIDNAFSYIVSSTSSWKDVDSAKPKGGSDPVGIMAREGSARRDASRKIPTERSGGGW